MRLPIRARLTAASVGLMAVVLAAAGVFLYQRLRADLMSAVDAGLRSRAEALVGSAGGSGTLLPRTGGLLEPDDAFAQVVGPGGQILESSPGLESHRLLGRVAVSAQAEGRIFEEAVPTVEELVPARLLVVPLSTGGALIVGVSLDDQLEALSRLEFLLWVGGPVVLSLAGAVGWLVAGRALRPVERMREEAAAISASEPGRRLPVPKTGDEIARLGDTLNRMLERLEVALERERRFVGDASHELRTPLANLRAELDLALRRSRTAEELEAALRSAAGETERLARLAEDLLVLARAEGGRIPIRRERAEVAGLVNDSVQTFAARAADRGVTVEARVPEGLRASVDPVRVRQALGNLLDNAIRHTSVGGRVSIEASRQDGSLALEVRDTGEGFPEEFLPIAFEPFARPDSSRSRADGGAGLGLALVRAVAEGHGGSAEARNHPEGGASVILRLPG